MQCCIGRTCLLSMHAIGRDCNGGMGLCSVAAVVCGAGGPTTDCRLRICTVVVQCMLQGVWAPHCLLVHVGRAAVVNMLGTWFGRYPVAMVFVDVHLPVQEMSLIVQDRSNDCAVDRGASRMSCSVYWLLSISPFCISGMVWDVAIHASFNAAVWDVAMMVSPACNQFSRALRVLGIYSNCGSLFWIGKDSVLMHWPLS